MLNVSGLLVLYLMHSSHKFISPFLVRFCNKCSKVSIFFGKMTRFDFSQQTSNILDKHFLMLFRHMSWLKRKKDEKVLMTKICWFHFLIWKVHIWNVIYINETSCHIRNVVVNMLIQKAYFPLKCVKVISYLFFVHIILKLNPTCSYPLSNEIFTEILQL